MSAVMEPLGAQDAPGVDLTGCDREPIHIPGAIQPHGLMLVVDDQHQVIQGAGRIEALTGRTDWVNAPLEGVLDIDIAKALHRLDGIAETGYLGRWRSREHLDYDVIVHRAGDLRLIEVEQSSQSAFLGVELLSRLDAAGAALERAASSSALCERAADEFRSLTGFDRVMIYRFLDDDAGRVLAESRTEGMPSFLNHHFPASDIPKQARALYLRNTVRVIPDVLYTPQPLRPEREGPPLDMSDCGLRSVSPVHMQYMKNMGIRATASVSIVMDGVLWGLVACHSRRPQLLTYELRVACATLARGLARQLKAKGDAETLRERLRLRSQEDELMAAMPLDMPISDALSRRIGDLISLVDADGGAVVRGSRVSTQGVCPPDAAVSEMARWVADRRDPRPIFTHTLAAVHAPAGDWADKASGLLAFVLPSEEPTVVMAFRAEQVETVRWAGDPHAAIKDGPDGALTPRRSFADWAETVRGRSRRWRNAEVEAAARLRDALMDLTSVRSLRTLNRALQESVADRDSRLRQQDFLLREVNHRVQNSLQLISSFLALQARSHGEGPASDVLHEARRRVRAVSLVHSRLYRSDQFETIDLSRYFGELIDEMGQSMGPEWARAFTLDLSPICVETSRAVTLGLVLTELIINAQKYAYDGEAGPIQVTLEEERASLRLIVEDEGRGGHKAGEGFGSRMIESLVGQLGGALEYRSAKPGLRAVVSAPIASAALA
ncbi:GAF domain-containing protein [Brevundimonas sp. S30B]|uniref:histidine kinase dimerization/phosphoacceptor domain -containing protein n=1 Tax=unclassified Brevundimonas TaxID=2622653 RepID=UPI0010722E9C|nr:MULTISPECIES: histidine kinase dimerization/phosphoacceptor domain -containing protein [unclassified Brevundimonas]QBX36413.1 GAF domain-containing protein [Brevundimonas sp. MF30-B]TFW00665.1 GAF domain-containing protein [Brevundimonas sp. S30B]